MVIGSRLRAGVEGAKSWTLEGGEEAVGDHLFGAQTGPRQVHTDRIEVDDLTGLGRLGAVHQLVVEQGAGRRERAVGAH